MRKALFFTLLALIVGVLGTTLVLFTHATSGTALSSAPTTTMALPTTTTTAPTPTAEILSCDQYGCYGYSSMPDHMEGGTPAPSMGIPTPTMDDLSTPCSMTYAINTHDAPAGGVAMVQEAVAKMAGITGRTITYVGTTDEHLLSERHILHPANYMVVGWDVRTDMFKDEAPTLGGITSRMQYTTVDKVTYQATVSLGSITMMLNPSLVITPSLLMHELGHAMNLDHSTDPGSLMYPTIKDGKVFSEEDLRMLSSVDCL